MASRSLDDLDSALKPLAQEFIDKCVVEGVDVVIYCTYRSSDEQNRLYAQGRNIGGKVVTNLTGGQSKHNCTCDGKPAARAFDAAPVVDGHIDWSGTSRGWRVMQEVGEGLGLRWGGNWAMRDMPHFELPGML